MNKLDLIQKIKALEGLSQDERAYLINLVNTKKKYGLVWEDKPEAVEELLRDHLPLLREVPDKAILNGDEHPNHLLIEGDNLHALSALAFTHEGQIDVIYIDPPYNTGNKDFKYNDSFVDKEDSYRHSKWLSFMEKRLKIAKKLLSDSGVIFISIDDNEQAQLKLLCDEVFGEKDFLNNIIWQKKYSPQNDAKFFSDNHDFILVFKKGSWRLNLLPRTGEQVERYKNPDRDPRGVWKSTDFSVKTYSAAYDYPIQLPSGRVVYPPASRSWVTSQERFFELVKDNRIWFGQSGNNVPSLKKFLSEVKDGTTPLTIWTYEEVGHNQSAKQEMKAVLYDVPLVFDTPKPIKLIDRILKISTNPEESFTILDFFAGSGTTLHATMQLNAEDGGNRRCILVTNNENNICEEVTYERNKRVIQGFTNSKGQPVAGLAQNNIRYYRCDFLSREPSLSNKKALTRLATDLLCIKEDCYREHAVEGGWMRLFSHAGGQYLCVIYDDLYVEEAVEALKRLIEAEKPARPVKVYVFSNGQYPYTEDFEDILEHVSLCALPDAIYKAYQHVLPRRTREALPEVEDPTAEDVEARLEPGTPDRDLFNQQA